jgi:hypothetical protein
MAPLACSTETFISRRELDHILQTLFWDSGSDPKVSVEAFTATATGLYDFLPHDQVDAALLAIPRDPSSGKGIAHPPVLH